MHFEKVSFGTFNDSIVAIMIEEGRELDAEELYKDLKLPKQATASSAGMDFIAPYDIKIGPSGSVLVPTGIRWVTDKTERGCVMMILPRSGLGFRTGMRLANTAGIIDPDYCDSANEGHIMLKVVNPKPSMALTIEKGKAFAQGIIVPYMICEGAESDEGRDGGFGSTDEK